jgi:hypothetical protein
MHWLCQLATTLALTLHVPQLACSGSTSANAPVTFNSERNSEPGLTVDDGGILIIPLPADSSGITDSRYAVATLEHGPNNNLAFCNAILKKKPSELLSYSAQPPAVVYWPIRISQKEFESRYSAAATCEDLIDIYDFDNAWIWQKEFDVSNLAGPRIISFDVQAKRDVFIDFSGYPRPVLREALDKWKKSIWNNKSIRGTPSADFVKAQIMSLYWKEYVANSRFLQFGFRK